MVKKGKFTNKNVPISQTEDEEEFSVDDEIDAFHKQKDKIKFEEQDEDSSSEFEEEPTLDLENLEDGEEEDEEEEEEIDGKWGKKKNIYYNVDYDDDLDSDEEAAQEEEEEVKRIQKKMREEQKIEDFEEPMMNIAKDPSKKNSKISKKSDAGILEEMKKDLEEITFDDDDKDVEEVKKDISALSKEEKLEIIMNDSPELLELLEDFTLKVTEIKKGLQPLIEKVKNDQMATQNGISFLEVKLHLLLSYCLNLSFYFLLKAEGAPVKDHPVISQLVKLRTILEKSKVLDQKLKHQIDKLLKAASTGAISENDPKAFKPKPELMEEDKEEEEEEEDDIQNNKKNEIYKVPQLAEVHFSEKSASKEKKQEERNKKRAQKSSMMKFIQQSFSDKPEEMPQAGVSYEQIDDEEEKHREQYEEDMFIRLNLSKEQKKKKQLKRKLHDELDDLDDFNDVAALDKKKNENSILKKKSMREIIQEIGEKKKNRTGDHDLPYRDPQSNKKKRMENDEEEEDYNHNSNNVMSDEDDDFYQQVKKTKQLKKQKKKGQRNDSSLHDYEDDSSYLVNGEKREITKEMKTNRGLTRSRPKDKKTAKTRYRNKYEEALKKRRGAVRKMVDKSKPYQGETTGINTRVVRSVNLKHH